MSQDDGHESEQDKPYEPTPRRLEQARKQGDLAKSNDVTTAAVYVAFLAMLLAVAEVSGLAFGEPLAAMIGASDQLSGQILGPGGSDVSMRLIGAAALACLPLFAGPFLAAILALLAQQAIVAAPTKLKPKASRLSLVTNAKQKYGANGLMEFAKSAAKLCLISLGLWLYMETQSDQLFMMPRLDATNLPALLLESCIEMLTIVAAIAALLAVVDYLWQRQSLLRRNRMTHEDMKRESKESDGDPHVKQSRQRRGREIANNRMLQDVPKADVVIVNPEHYAVALKWSRSRGAAPKCVAKGVDEVAARIREVAEKANVPIHSDPPTARSLYAVVDVGKEIEREHYQAVAIAIRFAEDMRKKSKERSWR